ncbi:hypothetical protein HMI54_003940 [Coelomomyces lativittatus]|nr:hypothetical protein HMI56_002209 [Coelomomyces lativittatus]KAJ1507675.1 hypothetical protein HMI54_003940 [Coelomomyces lativittatus]
MRMTHAIANQMKLSGSPGLILNLGSFAGLAPMPLLSVYGATKSFLYNWSQSIAHELKEDKIDVICLNTYYVVSEMSKIKKPSWMVPSAKSFVQSVLQNIGNEGGAGHAYTSSVYPSHAMMNWIISHVGTRRIWVKVFHMYLKLIREKALKKEKRMAESTLSTE